MTAGSGATARRLVRTVGLRIVACEARMALLRHRPRIVAVTGSVGKSSTKDLVASVLRRRYTVRESPENEINLPLVVLGLPYVRENLRRGLVNAWKGLFAMFMPHYPQWLVLEVGASEPRQTKRASRWLRTDIVVFTRFADVPAHIAMFRSREHLLEEKAGLIRSLRGRGIVVVNADDRDFMRIVKERCGRHRILTFGMAPSSQVRGKCARILYDERNGGPLGMACEVDVHGTVVSVRAEGVLGESHLYSILAAAAVAAAVDIPPHEVARAVASHRYRPARMRILDGMRGSVIIDDSYNSSPIAVEHGLAVLGELRCKGRKIVLLGGMSGLGCFAEEEHRKLGGRAAKVGDLLFAVGEYAERIAEGARVAGMEESRIHRLHDCPEAGHKLKSLVDRGDVVLVEGSGAATCMESALENFMLAPERKADLLARQGGGW